jgi:hypothetical protein
LLRDAIAEVEAALRQPEVPANVTDEQRIWALMELQDRADRPEKHGAPHRI